MTGLLLAVAYFVFFVAAHALCFRFQIISLRIFPAFAASLFWLGILEVCLCFVSAPLPMAAGALYGLLCLMYVNELVVFADQSPSLEIMRLVRGNALGAVELESRFALHGWVRRRLDALIRDGYVTRRQNRYFLHPRALKIVRFIQCYRSLLLRGPGG